MKRYTYSAQVTSVYGSQTYYVDAETEEDARAIVEGGNGVFLCEVLEVQDLEPFSLDCIEDIPLEPLESKDQ